MKKKFKLIRDKKLQSKRFALNSNKNRAIIDIKNMEISEQEKGYVRVRINTNEESGVPSIILAKANKAETISLFIAGGKCVDEKVARANAMIRIGKSGKI